MWGKSSLEVEWRGLKQIQMAARETSWVTVEVNIGMREGLKMTAVELENYRRWNSEKT